MYRRITESRRRAMRLYYSGQMIVVAGAAAMSWLESYVPMALACSAALMLTWPIVRDLIANHRLPH